MENTLTSISKFSLPYLTYKQDALEPHISGHTVDVHYNKHHRGYVKKLNKAVEANGLEAHSLEALLHNVSRYGDAVRNNGGGHYNHSMFWQILTPEKLNPYGRLLKEIEAAFHSYDEFREEFKKVALSRFGSGWAWLIVNDSGELGIGSTPNQDNPLMDVSELSGYPIMGLDMWEHAFYLDYQNRKAEYVDAFWNVVDWTEVTNRYEEARLLVNSHKQTLK